MKKLIFLALALALSAGLCAPALAAEDVPDEGVTEGLILDADHDLTTEAPTETEGEADIASIVTPDMSPEVEAVSDFTDVPSDHSFYTAIMDCAAKGITSGYSDGTFRPTNTVTRAQFCVMLCRAFYSKEYQNYKDVYTKTWFHSYAVCLNGQGILNSVSFRTSYDNAALMDVPISRYDMAQLMTNIMAKKGFSATSAQKNEAMAKISDYKSIPSANQDAVKNVFALGIITGYSDGSFGGSKAMNRGQGCVVIYRMMLYTPATSTGTGTSTSEYDDGKTKPGTSTGSGSTGTTTPTTPSTPSTPTTPTETAKTLTNGKAINEANVKAMLEQFKTQYPKGTVLFKTYSSGDNSPVRKATNNYRRAANASETTSTTRGCGATAAFFSDKVFGTNVTYRKVDRSQVKTGDLAIYLDNNGRLTHVAIVMEHLDAGSAALEIYGTPEDVGKIYSLSGGEVDSQTKIANWMEPRAASARTEFWSCY